MITWLHTLKNYIFDRSSTDEVIRFPSVESNQLCSDLKIFLDLKTQFHVKIDKINVSD